MAQAVNCWKVPNPSLDERMAEYWNKKHYQQIHANQVTQCWRQRSLHNEAYLQQVTSHNQKYLHCRGQKKEKIIFPFNRGLNNTFPTDEFCTVYWCNARRAIISHLSTTSYNIAVNYKNHSSAAHIGRLFIQQKPHQLREPV